MDPKMFYVAGALGLMVLAVVLRLRSKRRAKQRTEAMRGLAESLELDFFEAGNGALHARLSPMRLFNQGHKRTMTNVIIGETELASIALFDYSYKTEYGQDEKTYEQTVVAMESAALSLPTFAMRPQSVLDRVGAALGLQDINFGYRPAFSRAFVLQGEDEQAVRALFDNTVLDFFAERQGICIEGRDGIFIYYRYRKTESLENLPHMLDEGYSIYKAFLNRQTSC